MHECKPIPRQKHTHSSSFYFHNRIFRCWFFLWLVRKWATHFANCRGKNVYSKKMIALTHWMRPKRLRTQHTLVNCNMGFWNVWVGCDAILPVFFCLYSHETYSLSFIPYNTLIIRLYLCLCVFWMRRVAIHMRCLRFQAVFEGETTSPRWLVYCKVRFNGNGWILFIESTIRRKLLISNINIVWRCFKM